MVSLVFLTNKKNGTVYAYINEKVYDSERKEEVYRRRCVGHLDPKTGKVLPNRPKKIAHSYSAEAIGLNMLFSAISADIGLTHALRIAFSRDWSLILTCAIYCVCSKEPLSEITDWSRNNENPLGRAVTLDDLKGLMSHINPDSIESFFKIWNRKLNDTDAVIFSIRCVDSYQRRIGESRFGIRLSQDSFVSDYEICYGRNRKIPIAYRYHATPLTDLQYIFTGNFRFPWLDMDSYTYMTSPEIFTDEMLNSILSSRSSYIAEVPNTTDLAKDTVKRFRKGMISEGSEDRGHASERFYAVQDRDVGGKTVHQHLFYDVIQEEVESAAFMNLIDKCRKELEEGIIVVPHTRVYENYYTMVKGDDGTVTVDLDAEKIMEATESAGFKMIITDSINDPAETFRWSIIRDDAVYLYGDMKNSKDNSNLRLYLSPNSGSRDFIQFIALIISSALGQRMIDTGLSDQYDMEDVLTGMSAIYNIRADNRKGAVRSVLNDDQELMVSVLGLR